MVTVYCANWQGREVASQHRHDTETEGKTQVVVSVEAIQTADYRLYCVLEHFLFARPGVSGCSE